MSAKVLRAGLGSSSGRLWPPGLSLTPLRSEQSAPRGNSEHVNANNCKLSIRKIVQLVVPRRGFAARSREAFQRWHGDSRSQTLLGPASLLQPQLCLQHVRTVQEELEGEPLPPLGSGPFALILNQTREAGEMKRVRRAASDYRCPQAGVQPFLRQPCQEFSGANGPF